MENLKKGDTVEISSKDTTYTLRATTGCRYTVSEKPRNGIVKVDLSMFLRLHDVKKIGESQMQYEESNRYKLAQAIKKTGISAKALSRAVAGNECYFYNKTGVARFNKRGDISNDVLNLALTDLAFAEREVLDIGAKTVEEPSDAEIQMIDFAKAVDISGKHDDQADSVSYAIQKLIENQERKKIKPKSNKPLFIGATVVISIVLILFILNNYFQVV